MQTFFCAIFGPNDNFGEATGFYQGYGYVVAEVRGVLLDLHLVLKLPYLCSPVMEFRDVNLVPDYPLG